ncbi:hypothetical protein Y032_0001g269 [Ancylostoma ceylanicum]|uniref:Uncharacterized protein n=1 Tax=Ancylostoma ceylanicum TaxID=53326 RepID=A0A016W4D5_9BILA|nr:hypothetical protein Y032_0001g269 [Ancylostoma ceylanicum]
MNEISPDTIKERRWVGSHVEEGEPGRRRRTRMRGDAVVLGRRQEGVIMLCKRYTFINFQVLSSLNLGIVF